MASSRRVAGCRRRLHAADPRTRAVQRVEHVGRRPHHAGAVGSRPFGPAASADVTCPGTAADVAPEVLREARP